MKSVLKKIMWTAIAAVAIFITALIIRVIWEQRQLDAGSKRINAVIEQVSRVHHEEHMQKVGRHRYRKMPAYTETIIHYTYVVDGKSYSDDISTRHPMLRRIWKGDSIPVRYARSNPEIHRAMPDSIRKNRRPAFAY